MRPATTIPTLSDLRAHVSNLPRSNSPVLFCTPLTPFDEERFQHQDGIQYQITVVAYKQGVQVIQAQEAVMENGEVRTRDLDKKLIEAFIL